MKKWFSSFVAFVFIFTFFGLLFSPPQTYALSSCATTFRDLDLNDTSMINTLGCLNQQYCVVRGNDGNINANTQVTRQEAIALIARYHIEVLRDWPLSTNPNSYWTDFPNVDSTIFFPLQTAGANPPSDPFIRGYDNGNGTRSLDPHAPWLFGFSGVNKNEYNFQAPGSPITRGEFLKKMFSYGKARSQVNACTITNCGVNNPCSDFYGCARTGPFKSSTADCKTPVQDPSYTTDQICGYKGKGDDSRCVAPQHNPIGYFDSADANGLKGWACDIDGLNTVLRIDLYIGGPAGQGTQIDSAFTKVDRPDTGALCKDANGNPTIRHGFLVPVSDIPAQYKNGQAHQIYAYAENVGGGTGGSVLGFSPRTFTYQSTTECPARCSNSLGCTRVEKFNVSNNDCTQAPAVIGNLTYTKVAEAECPKRNGAFGGNDNNCPAPAVATPTPTTPPPSDGTTCPDITNANGYVKLVYTPTESGTYTVWTRMKGAKSTDGYYLQVGNICNVLVGGSGISTSDWQWVNYRDGDSGKKVTVTLQQGVNYTVHIAGRDTGTKVDLVKFDKSGCTQLEGADGHCVPTTSNGTILDLDIVLHAVGVGGDNTNPNGGGGNPTPLNPQRDVTVLVYNATTNALVAEKTGKINFVIDATKKPPAKLIGQFTATVDLGDKVLTGSYIVKIKTPYYLRKQYDKTQLITAGKVNTLPLLTMVAADSDNNNKIDLFDYRMLSECYSDFAPAQPTCTAEDKKASDINDDGKVNSTDFNYFVREISVQNGAVGQ